MKGSAPSGLLARPRTRSLRSRRRRRTKALPSLPPTFVADVHTSRQQYQVLSTFGGNTLNRGMFAMVAGAFGTVLNSTVVSVASSYRINHIRAWPAAGGDVDIEWYSTGSAEQALNKDVAKQRTLPTGITVSGCMSFVPPPGSYASMWQTANINATDNLAVISATAGSVIEVSISWTNWMHGSGVSQTGYTAVTVGSFYKPYLDGPTQKKLMPVAYPTTT